MEKNRLGMWFARNCDAGVWRLEFQHRKLDLFVPHWHVLAFIGTRDVDEWMAKNRGWWDGSKPDDGRWERADSSLANTHERGTHHSDGDGRSSFYFAMHAAKREQAPPFRVGRWWGYVNRDALLAGQRIYPLGEVLERERVWWARLYRRSTGCKVRHNSGFSWFLSAAGQTRAREWVFKRCAYEAATRGHGGRPF